jgi:long-chain acyl-CoA synthetase
MNLSQTLESNSKKYSQRPAIIFKNEPISFRQLTENSFRLASSLINLGIKKGDKVAIYLSNCPEYIYAYLATWCIGATAVPLDFMLTSDEIVSCLSHSQSKLLIARLKPGISLEEIKRKVPTLKHISTLKEKEGFLPLKNLLEKRGGQVPSADIPDKDYASIFYTSGSTGKPKGVLCNYAQIGAPHQAMVHFTGLNDKDITLCGALPFSHLGGLVFIQSILFLGTTMVLMDRFIPSEFLNNIQKFKVTNFWLVPSMYYAILHLKEFETFDLSSLKWIVVFGAPSSVEQLRRFHQFCPNAKFINGWGMTETQGPSITNSHRPEKLSSIGISVPWIEVKVFDQDDKELIPGQIGEIVVRSWVVTDGYYKDPELTTEVKRNGWFHTGDLGRFDAEGDLYIMGRKREMIKVAGEIVFEPEVESAIHKHPEVAEVAVIGVPDELRGEVPRALVALKKDSKLTEEGLRYFCKEHLAHFKIPHYFEFRDSLPKNRSGKVDKESLRDSKVNK